MKTLRLLAIRQGGTEWTPAQRFTGSRDLPLSAEGQTRAEAVARVLQDQTFTAVYASPLERARTTAEILAKPHRATVRIEPAFRDMAFGDWEGLTPDEIATRWPEGWTAWREAPASVTTPGGERLADVGYRVGAGIARLREAHPDGTVALVAHAIPIRLLVLTALGLGLERLWSVDASPAGMTELEYAQDWITVHRMNTLP